MTTPILIQATPILASLNLEETEAFYTRHLGFQTIHLDPGAYAILARDQVELHFWLCTDPTVPTNTACRIHVRGLGTLYAACQAASIVHPHGSLQTKPWGTQEFTILDTHGNGVTFIEAVSSGLAN